MSDRDDWEAMNTKPIVVSSEANADEMNSLHGERYGTDWIYPTPEAFMVLGNYTAQPFRSKESAEAYLKGLLATDPEGGYTVKPLYFTSSCNEITQLQAERDAFKADNAAIRELLNAYNLGGWTDSLRLIQERDALAAQNEQLREALKYHQEKTRPIQRTIDALSLPQPLIRPAHKGEG